MSSSYDDSNGNIVILTNIPGIAPKKLIATNYKAILMVRELLRLSNI